MVHLDHCPHSLHPPCYAALRIKAAATLRCPTCRAAVTVEEADRRAFQQHSEEVMIEAMAAAQQTMPARRGGGGVIPQGHTGRQGRASDMQHVSRVGGGDRLRASALLMRCTQPLRTTVGFVEDAISRARANGARTLTHQVTCLNPVLHAVHQEVDLHTHLQQIHGLGRFADTAEERTINARVTAANLQLSRSSTTLSGTVDLSRSASERGEEEIVGDWRDRIPHQPQVKTPCGACREHIIAGDRFAFTG